MGDRLRLDIVTPERRILSEEVEEVRIPGALGELGILPGHTPLLTAIGTGPLSYTAGSQQHTLAVQGGFAEVLPEQVTILATIAEDPSEVDVAAARTKLETAAAALSAASAEEIGELSDAVRLATTRIEVGGKD